MRSMEVLGVGATPRGVTLFVRELQGEQRVLPVSIGLPEAVAIEIELQGRPCPRPLTHQLIARVVEGFGRRLDHVEVTALREGVFHAELVLDHGVRISSRVSDAVALALHQHTPISAAEEVLDAAGTSEYTVIGVVEGDASVDPRVADEQLERFREELDRVDPDDFGSA